jgi:hypothetical protein
MNKILHTKFPLGQVVITANAQARLDSCAVHEGLRRHAAGDWGDISPHDAAENDAALLQGDGGFMSAYGAGDGRFWIITEADRSVTTVLLPEDY